MMFTVLALLQVGQDLHTYPQADLPVITQRRHDAPAPDVKPLPDPRGSCLSAARHDPDAAQARARAALAAAKTPEARVLPDTCLGQALSETGDFEAAAAAFGDAVLALPKGADARAAPIMAMAGNATLAAGDANAALDWFTRALALPGFVDKPARGGVAADRARALVALNRSAEAQAALADAREWAPRDATVFLLSATLARRAHELAAAQRMIETAATLDPRDPAIGLEAGVIAELAGHERAARASWQSVMATAPDSDEARVAQGYLAQLGPAPRDAQGH